MGAIRKSSRKQRRYSSTPQLPFFALNILVILIACPLAAPRMADATIYRCIGHNGEMVYTNIRNHRKCVPLASLHKQKKYRSAGKRSVKNSHIYDAWIHATAARYGVDYALIKAIIHIESGFDHLAVSRRGARGLMQLMPETSRELHVHNPFNPQQNIDAGVRYFRQIMNDFNGDISLSLAAYNAGPNLVKRIGRIPAIPETRKYVRKVLKMYQIYKGK